MAHTHNAGTALSHAATPHSYYSVAASPWEGVEGHWSVAAPDRQSDHRPGAAPPSIVTPICFQSRAHPGRSWPTVPRLPAQHARVGSRLETPSRLSLATGLCPPSPSSSWRVRNNCLGASVSFKGLHQAVGFLWRAIHLLYLFYCKYCVGTPSHPCWWTRLKHSHFSRSRTSRLGSSSQDQDSWLSKIL